MKSRIIGKSWLSVALVLSMLSTAIARENVSSGSSNSDGHKLTNVTKVLSGCLQGVKQTEIKLNNVRTRILTCGDMWWDVNSNPKYEIPKGSGSYASFAGSLWFGGYTNNSLKVSAMTYRQTGVDFWPGPLDPISADVDAATCNAYDKHWRFNRADVDEFYAKYAAAFDPLSGITSIDANYSTPSWIKDFPGSAPSASDPYNYLAPFVDADNSGTYNWQTGDYPAYNVKNTQVTQGNCKHFLFGDETLFWVFNDKGGNHTETGSVGTIGVEIRAQAFEFATSDVLNDMTFYNFEIINRSTNVLDCTYFAVWVDADLGNYNDDYVGCDVTRGLGYIYNGDAYDDDNQGVIGYHGKLPALGCDFFQGPNADLNDSLDNDRDGCIDCTWRINQSTGLPDQSLPSIDDDSLPEHISMAKFVPYSNDNDAKTGNPSTTGAGKQYYYYMSGRWRDGSSMRYDGLKGTSNAGPKCSYMFPGSSDQTFGYGVGGGPNNPQASAVWTEVTAANSKGDRRFLQSAGRFTLQPGAVNTITYGMPFVRTNSDDNFAAIPLLVIADDKAQSLFDNCFKVLDGPDAPDLTIQEMENQLIIYFSNKQSSNNYEQDRYSDIDPTISPILGPATDKVYRFEGYMVFQVKDETVSASDLYNSDKSRLVFQCDKKNGVSTLINYTTDATLGNVPQLMTPEANDKGIINSFLVNEDLFAQGDKKLVNHKTYYYMAVAYAYNNYLPYKQDVAPSIVGGNTVHPTDGDYDGQKKPFLQGRRNVKIYSAVPHNINPEANGTVINTTFGFGPKVKRIEGQGNGGNAVDLTDATIANILASPNAKADVLEYENNRGPIQVKVIDPLKVLSGDFTVKVKRVIPNAAANDDSLVDCLTSDLDSGKVKSSYKYQVIGNYTNSSGQLVTKTWNSDEVIGVGQEFILIGDDQEPIGISVTVSQVEDPAGNMYPYPSLPTLSNPAATVMKSTTADELLESSLTFSNSSQKWLTGVVDIDGDDEKNWIRSGIVKAGAGGNYNDANVDTSSKTTFDDPNQVYENVVGGTWAPYRLCAASKQSVAPASALKYAPAIGDYGASFNQWARIKNYELDKRTISSVDVVFTSDKSKWTRCVVLEMGYTNSATNSNIGNQRKFLPRKSQSVDVNGNSAAVGSGSSTNPSDPNYISETGMGWFPGYAINVETGERLNIAFGENSSDAANNGADMFWNPTNSTSKFGGMHYIYIFGHNSDGVDGTGEPIDVPRYDGGAALFKMLNKTISGSGNTNPTTGYGQQGIVEAFKDAMWVNLPLVNSAYSGSFAAGRQPSIPCDAKVKIRVAKPLRYGLAANWASSYSIPESGATIATFVQGTTYLNSINPAYLTEQIVSSPQNNNFPMYTFSTQGLGASTNVTETAKSALDIINIVPNPYYGHSQYEKTRLDNYIKIVNLPVKCTIRIYSVNGTLIRTIKKDTDATTDIQWDLKNEKNILISSGLYVVHVDAGDLGEKILKWFCVMRPIDLQSY